MSHVWTSRMSHVTHIHIRNPRTCSNTTRGYHSISHVTHMNESCHTYGWVLSNVWMSHVTHMNEACCTYEWIMSHIWMSHVSDMNESCHTYEWVMSHIWMSHVSHMNESCRSCEWVKSLCVVMCSGVLHRFVVCLFCQNIGLFCQNVGLFRQNIGLFSQSRSSHSRRRWWYFRLKPFKKKWVLYSD